MLDQIGLEGATASVTTLPDVWLYISSRLFNMAKPAAPDGPEDGLPDWIARAFGISMDAWLEKQLTARAEGRSQDADRKVARILVEHATATPTTSQAARLDEWWHQDSAPQHKEQRWPSGSDWLRIPAALLPAKVYRNAIADWLEDQAWRREIICLSVSGARLNPRYQGRVLTDGYRHLLPVAAHLAYVSALSQPANP